MSPAKIEATDLKEINVLVGPEIDTCHCTMDHIPGTSMTKLSHIHPMTIESEFEKIVENTRESGDRCLILTHNFDVIATILSACHDSGELNTVQVARIGVDDKNPDGVIYISGEDAYDTVCRRGFDLR